MSGLVSTVVGWVAGFIALIILFGLLNGVIALVHRITHGPKRIDQLVLMVKLEALMKHAKQAVTGTPGGGVNIDGVKAIVALFPAVRQVLSEREIKAVASKGNLALSILTHDVPSTGDDAAGLAVRAMLGGRLTMEQLKKTHVYWVSSTVTPASDQAYLVLVGNLPDPPVTIVPSFD